MKFRAVLVLPLSEQSDRDDRRIDPAGLAFDPDKTEMIFREFDYEVVVGSGRISRADDGSLVVEGDITDPALQKFMAAGIYVDEKTEPPLVVTKSRLMSVSTTDDHSDPNQPPIVFEEG